MQLNFSWIIKLWNQTKTDKTPASNSIALLDLNEHCLRHIGRFLSMEDAYSFGHTCTQLFEIMSKLRVPVTIRDSNDFRYLTFFKAAASDLTVDTTAEGRKSTDLNQRKLLSIMETCPKITNLKLLSLNSIILSSKWFNNIAHKLLHLSLIEVPKICWPKFIESMRECENLTNLYIADYEETFRFYSDELEELFSIEFPKLKVFCFDALFDSTFVPINTLLRHNNRLKSIEIAAPLFEVYLDALLLCPNLEKVTLHHEKSVVEVNLMAKLLALNKLPALKYTSLKFPMHVNTSLTPMVQRIQSIKELIITCTLCENFIQDIFRCPQITSLQLIILLPLNTTSLISFIKDVFLSRNGFPKVVQRLRYHEQSLKKLTKLDLSHVITIIVTNNDLTEFIKFIINCPKIELIEFDRCFPIDRFYKQLLKYEKNFGHHAREKTLHLTIDSMQWIPGYSDGRRTHNIIVEDRHGHEVNKSISSIIWCVYENIFRETPLLSLCMAFFAINNLIINLV
ncbi:uncharacterized protein LOC119066025 [Bradysia coprophila]|uniref:uncharacterized protein LOC119066025 n=1 Tax=Bradysia coprophila TaxID=38358 RepID=UPI00187DB621|nr:uncharacterized protein LOC119066025 [Bradysia coprophila]